MLDANELGLKATSDAELEMKADDEEENGEVTTSTDKNDKQGSTRILKQMTMKVFDSYWNWWDPIALDLLVAHGATLLVLSHFFYPTFGEF